MIAIVWKNNEQTETVAKPVFSENGVDFTEISEKDATDYKENFRKENFWYHSADVDMLSREEAATIAASLVKWSLENNLITPDEANKIKADVEAYFKEELVKLRTREQLNDEIGNHMS